MVPGRTLGLDSFHNGVRLGAYFYQLDVCASRRELSDLRRSFVNRHS